MTSPSVLQIRAGGILLLSGILLVACAPAGAQVPLPPPPQEGSEGTLQVTGQARIMVPTDRTSLDFGVETESPSASEAAALNAEKMDAVFAALEGLGIRGLEMETHGYHLSPSYRRPQGAETERIITGYRAANNIQVRIPSTEGIGEIMDAAIQAGANRVTGLRFEASDTREARLRALREAVGTAREEAEAMTEAMGVRLGPALEVQGGASPPRPVAVEELAMRRTVAMEAPPTTTIEPGRQAVSAHVTITYRILEGSR